MARGNTVTLNFEGNAADLNQAFDKVGAGSKEMAAEIDQSTERSRRSFGNLEGGVDGSQQKFRGLSDTIEGSGDIMEGFRTGNLALLGTGFADLAGGMTDLVFPAIKKVGGLLMTGLAPALTFIAAHPLFLAIAAGGAIIAALIFLEKKFGVVSKAIDGIKAAASAVFNFLRPLFLNFTPLGIFINHIDKIKGAFLAVWNFIRPIIRKIGNAIESVAGPLGSVVGAIGDVGGFLNPFGHTGGLVPGHAGQNVPMILQAGERIIPRGQDGGTGTIVINVSGVGMGRDFGRAVADALRDNRLIGVT